MISRNRDAIGGVKEKRADKLAALRDMTDRCERDQRDMTKAEGEAFNRIEDAVRDFDREIAHLEVRMAQEPESPGRQVRQVIERDGDDYRARRSEPVLLGREQRMADLTLTGRSSFDKSEADDFSLGRAIRGAMTGEWQDAELEQRALAEGTNSAGGFLTPEVLSTRIIDRVRAKARVLEAGAQTLRLDSDNVALPRLTSGVTPAWRNENAPNAESDPAFDRVTFTPRSLAVAVKLSYELVEDMVDGGAELIENELLAALALKVDAAALRGSGTPPEPTGLRFQPGVTVTSLGANGASLTYGALMSAITVLYGGNHTNLSAIMAPRTAQGLASLTDTTNQPLNPPKPVADMPWYVTNQVPVNLTQGTATTASDVYVGDFSNLVIGVKPFLKIDFQRRGVAELGGNLKASSELLMGTQQVYVLATLRADVQLLHPDAFNVLTGAL